MSKLWKQIKEYTFEIKKFADEGDFDSAIILSKDLTKFLEEANRQKI